MSPRRISPASDSIRRTTQRASVLLPDPDSPTMPNVSPRRNASDTLLTASIPRLARRKNRLRAPKVFDRSRTARIFSGFVSSHFARGTSRGTASRSVFVGDDHIRLQDQRHGNDGALALAAG